MTLIRNLAFIALSAATAASSAAAPDLHIDKSVTINAPADAVWAKVKDFNALNTWHPAVAKDELVSGENNVPGAQRLLTLGDGGTIKERLVNFSEKDRTYTYVIVESVLPVSEYTSTLTVKPAGKGTSTVNWSGHFKRKNQGEHPADNENDAIAKTTITGIYQGGFDNLSTLFGTK